MANKQPFATAVAADETLEHPTFAAIEPARRFHNASLADWAYRRLAPDAEIFGDGLGCSGVSSRWIIRTPC